MAPDPIKEYRARRPALEAAAQRIEDDLTRLLHGFPHVDSIRARAKALDRFAEKTTRKAYKHPLEEMQDQIGARVVVYYLSDVDAARKRILKQYSVIEDLKHEPHNPTIFDYEAWHMICSVPPSLRSDCPVSFFELQIATLFQHAWAETHHDLGYKPGAELPFETKRRVAHAAAQAWGADQTMEELLQRTRSNG